MSFREAAAVAADVVTAAGIVGLFFAYRQLRLSLRAQREATAMSIWMDYLQLAQSRTEFSEPNEFLLSGKDLAKLAEYLRFMTAFLFACERLVQLEEGKSAWRETVRYELRRHHTFLSSSAFRSAQVSPRLATLIKDALSASG